MTWIPTLAPWQWGVLALVPLLIVLMYFLKLRRQPVEVPSTYLWSRTIEDLHVNSLLQRMRRNLLLLLQLLAVAFAALALLRPGNRGDVTSQDRYVLMIDRSASMQATDVDGTSRFERAKRIAASRIDSLQDTEAAMLVAFDSRAEVLQPFTSDRRRLREALERCTVSNRATDIVSALRAADGMAASRVEINPSDSSNADSFSDGEAPRASRVEPAKLVLLSDGGFARADDVELENLLPEYIAVGSAAPRNLAVTAFSADRNPEKPSEIETFTTITNFATESMSATATLMIDDAWVDAASVELEPGEQTGLAFQLENENAVTLKILLDVDDDLSLDNVAYAGIAPSRLVKLLVVGEGNKPLELALGTLEANNVCSVELAPPSFLNGDAYREQASIPKYDLVIFDRCSPPTMPAANTLFFGELPPEGWKWTSEPQPLILIDADRTHPLMRYVEMLSLLIYRGRAVDGPSGTKELVSADAGTAMALAPRDGYQDLVIGFEVVSTGEDGAAMVNTNWYTERSWPVFIFNALRFLAGAAEGSAAQTYTPGSTVRVRSDVSSDNLAIYRDENLVRPLAADARGNIEFAATEEPGNYRVLDGEKLLDLFSVNLFDRRESQLATAESVSLGYQSFEATQATTQQRREYWRWLLVAMLGILVCEWWVYAKRIQ